MAPFWGYDNIMLKLYVNSLLHWLFTVYNAGYQVKASFPVYFAVFEFPVLLLKYIKVHMLPYHILLYDVTIYNMWLEYN